MPSERQFSQLGKLQTPVELNDSAGPVPPKPLEISSLLPPLENAPDETPDPVINPAVHPVVHPAVPPVMPPVVPPVLAHVMAPVSPNMLEPGTPVRTPVIP
jgi:hypothetical protein